MDGDGRPGSPQVTTSQLHKAGIHGQCWAPTSSLQSWAPLVFHHPTEGPLYSLLGRHFGILRADFTLAASVDPEDRKEQLLQEVRLSMLTPAQPLVPHSHLGSW